MSWLHWQPTRNGSATAGNSFRMNQTNRENPSGQEIHTENTSAGNPRNPENPLDEKLHGENGLGPYMKNPRNPLPKEEGVGEQQTFSCDTPLADSNDEPAPTAVNGSELETEIGTAGSASIDIGPTPVTYRLVTDREEAVALLSELSTTALVGLDTETTGLDSVRDRIRLIQIARGERHPVIIINCFRVPLEALREVLGELRVVGHNMVFDSRMLAAAKVQLRQTPECTLLLNHALTGRMEDLKTLAARELGIELPKEHQLANWSGELSEEMLEYAARDAATPLTLAEHLRAIVEERGAFQVYGLMRDAQAAIVEMELAGIGFDIDQHRQLLLDAGRRQSTALWELRRWGLEDPNSAKATASWLERFASRINWPRTKSRQLCTNAATVRYLARLLPAEGHEAVEKLLQYRDSTKLLSTYGSKFAGYVHPDTGRIHAQFLLAGTRTGRLSCRSPNLQQIPRDPAFRGCFRAPEGRRLVVSDYSQIELRVAAIVAREPKLLEAYEKGVDVHRETAARLLGKRPEDVSKYERQLAKAVNFEIALRSGRRRPRTVCGR